MVFCALQQCSVQAQMLMVLKPKMRQLSIGVVLCASTNYMHKPPQCHRQDSGAVLNKASLWILVLSRRRY